MTKLKQNERVYFKIADGVEGYATVAGDYDLIVILKPEKPINNYSHIYVSKTQIVDHNTPIVPREVDDDESPANKSEGTYIPPSNTLPPPPVPIGDK